MKAQCRKGSWGAVLLAVIVLSTFMTDLPASLVTGQSGEDDPSDTDQGPTAPRGPPSSRTISMTAYSNSSYINKVMVGSSFQVIFVEFICDSCGVPSVIDSEGVWVHTDNPPFNAFTMDLQETSADSKKFRGQFYLRDVQDPWQFHLGVVAGHIVNVSWMDNGTYNYRFPIGKIRIKPYIEEVKLDEEQYWVKSFETTPLEAERWEITGDHEWLHWNEASHTLSGHARNKNVGTNVVYLRATDFKGNYDELKIYFNITNKPPNIFSKGKYDVFEDNNFFCDLESDDEDKPTARWSMTSKATWLKLDIFTGVLNGTPTNDEVGVWDFNVSFFDGNNMTAHLDVNITVHNVNDPPTWVTLPTNESIRLSDTYTANATAEDIDVGDKLVYSMRTYPHTSAAIDPLDGAITWQPTQVGTHLLNISVTDLNVTLYHVVILDVIDVNSPPMATLLSPAHDTTGLGFHPTLKWNLSDEDGDEVITDVYLSTDREAVRVNHPTALYRSSVAGTELKVDTMLEEKSIYYWTVVPHDGMAYGTCPEMFEFSTAAYHVNSPPRFFQTKNREIKTDEILHVAAQAEDPDSWDMQNLTYELVSYPNGMFIDERTGEILWDPAEYQTGNFSVLVKVTDTKGTEMTEFFVVVKRSSKGTEPAGVSAWVGTGIAVVVAILLMLTAAFLGRRKARSTSEQEAALASASSPPPHSSYGYGTDQEAAPYQAQQGGYEQAAVAIPAVEPEPEVQLQYVHVSEMKQEEEEDKEDVLSAFLEEDD